MTIQSKAVHEEMGRILELRGKNKLARGEKRYHEGVTSSIWRKNEEILKDPDNRTVTALKIEEDMVRRARMSHAGFSVSNVELLARLQHHGGRTNLIDFTENILIALFFACEKAGTDSDEDGRIVLFDVDGMDPVEDIDYEKGDDKSSFVVPVGKDPRIVFQSSVFIHAPKGYLEKEQYEEIRIKKEMKAGFRQYLSLHFNIKEETIYNDLPGFIRIEEKREHPSGIDPRGSSDEEDIAASDLKDSGG